MNNNNEAFFITEWLVAGPKCSLYNCDITSETQISDQLGYEKLLRKNFTPVNNDTQAGNIRLGELAPCNSKWEYYCNPAGDTIFVDKSAFYPNPTTIELNAATILKCSQALSVNAVLFTYALAEVWLNGEKIFNGTPPVYKPIKKEELSLNLNQGENLLFVKLNNLGIRDARTLFSILLNSNDNDIEVVLPDYEHTNCLTKVKKHLNTLTINNNKLEFAAYSNYPTYISFNGSETNISTNTIYNIPHDVQKIRLKVQTPYGAVEKQFEIIDNDNPKYIKTEGSPLDEILKALAMQESELRGSGAYFSSYNVLARYALGQNTPNDDTLIRNDLKYINARGDCADFLVAAIARLILKYDINEKLYADIKENLLRFRYWMDEPGNDGMCFWSENHALMFHGSQLILSELFKNDLFSNSGKLGKDINVIALQRCTEWLDDIEKDDFEEFNSATYVPVTVAALLNIVDFAPNDLSMRATKLLDKIFTTLCQHVFCGVAITPQGRVYRDLIIPYEQTVQSILYLIDSEYPFPKTPLPFTSMFATTKYKIPQGLKNIIDSNFSKSYVTGRTQINLEKNQNYILTSVSSPSNAKLKHWTNNYNNSSTKHDSYLFTKSMNECFHGTSNFRPGTYGYQQHLWSAAISDNCIVFVNHPGFDVDGGGMRPGYWYGNSVTPAVKQQKNVLAAIYSIPSNNPIRFTHAFWPTAKFDEWFYKDNWLIGKSKNAYIGLWCSEEMIPYSESVLQNCEYRCNSMQAAYVCICEDDTNAKNIDDFMIICKKTQPQYNKNKETIRLNNEVFLTYEINDDKTQYV